MNQKHTITTKPFPGLTYTIQGQGPAIMLLHGFPASGSLWDKIVPSLAQSHTVLVPDIPGTGNSPLDGEEVSLEELAVVRPTVLDHAGIERCTLVGHSMGGYISLAVAELYTDLQKYAYRRAAKNYCRYHYRNIKSRDISRLTG